MFVSNRRINLIFDRLGHAGANASKLWKAVSRLEVEFGQFKHKSREQNKALRHRVHHLEQQAAMYDQANEIVLEMIGSLADKCGFAIDLQPPVEEKLVIVPKKAPVDRVRRPRKPAAKKEEK